MENFGKEPTNIHVYQYRSPKRKGRSAREKEELLTDKNKKQISEEFITGSRRERRKRKI